MLVIQEKETGVYTIRLTGKEIKSLTEDVKKAGMSPERIFEGCLRFGIAFLMYLFED